MVFTGRPSKACHRCRSRRLKCDLGRPKCRKCDNAGVECPGYRDEQDLLFKNITDQVIERHQVATANGRNHKHSPSRTPPDTKPTREKSHTGLIAVALTFLFESYFKGSSFEWVQGLYEEALSTSLFAGVVESTAIAAYSYESHRSRLLAQARIAYDKDLNRLREVLSAPGAVSNETLASILLMSRFETLLADGTEAVVTDSWMGHIAGAYSIVEARSDADNFDDRLSCRLAEQIVHNYNMYCLRERKIRSKSLIAMTEKLHHKLGSLGISALRRLRLQQHALSEAFVRCRQILLPADISSIRAAVVSAAILDDQVQAFCIELNKLSPYEVKSVKDLVADGPGSLAPRSEFYHVYESHHAMRMWNAIRMLVITVSLSLYQAATRVLADKAEPTGKDLKAELDQVIKRCRVVVGTMSDQVCDSAPHFLQPGTPDCTYAAASYLAWPLFVAARMIDSTEPHYARHALAWIGEEFNIKSAKQAAVDFENLDQYDDWLLACYMF